MPLPSNPWCPPFERRKPAPQPFYRFSGDTWKATDSTPRNDALKPSKIKLISWNIDALGQGAAIRMAAALQYLEKLVSSIDSSVPIVFFFQEMLPSDLELIQAAPWVRERFTITDLSNKYWESMWYGTTTLVDNRLDIERVFRVHFDTAMERDGLFVDVGVQVNGGKSGTLRLCNTHLESLIDTVPYRPGQVKLAAEYMQKSEVYAAALAGDCNSIQPFDRTLHSDNGLKDVYLEGGGHEDKDEGYTWGQMADPVQRERFGCSRMDKIMYCGGVRAEAFEYAGVDVKVGEEYWETMKAWGVTEFVTDHYGVMADLVVVKNGQTANL
jgi:tyrosyl-DNA phosphodiesterase 2